MNQKHFEEIINKVPKELKKLMLAEPLLSNAIHCGINENLEYTKIIENTLLCYVECYRELMSEFYKCKLNCNKPSIFKQKD